MKNLHIDLDNDGVRLDRVLRKNLPDLSLSTIYRALRKGKIRVNNRRVKQNYRLNEGEEVEIDLHTVEAEPEKKGDRERLVLLFHTGFYRKNFNILFEDENLLVCNKPGGLVVHSGTKHKKNDTLIDLAAAYMLHKNKAGKFTEPVLVHRLDRDTSGVILIAKDKRTLRMLHESIRKREIVKKYIALCHGKPSVKKGRIDLSLKRTHEQNSGMKVRVCKNGQHASSSFRVIESNGKISRIEINLHTGRTHQIRVHLAYISCPVIGDKRYGNSELDRKFFSTKEINQRLFLHAETISFFYPMLKREVSFSAPVPGEFKCN